MNKKILISLSVIGAIAAIAVGGTIAYFSDTETSTGNSFAAGTLDLQADNAGAAMFSLTNRVPGQSGEEDIELKNAGSNADELEITISAITNVGGAGGTEYEDGVGNLGANLEMVLWLDVNQNNTFDDGDVELINDGTVAPYNAVANPSLTYVDADTYDSDNWDAVLAAMAVDAKDDFQINWQIPTDVGNNIQGDSMSFDLTFVLEQAAAD